MSNYPDESGARGTSAPSRVPPHSQAAEEAVLGSMMLNPDAIVEAMAECTAEDFYRPLYGQMFAAMVDLDAHDQPVDPLTVLEQMRANGNQNVDASLIAEIVSNTANTTNARYYASLVRLKAQQRRLIQVSSEIVDDAYLPTDDVEGLLDRAASEIVKVTSTDREDTVSPINQLLQNKLNELEEGEKIAGLSTGFTRLDNLLQGIGPETLVVIGARPSVGKTAFALGLVTHVGAVLKRPALFFSLEMGKSEVAGRLLSSESRVDGSHLKTGKLSDNDWNKVTNGMAALSGAKIFVDDSGGLTVMDVRARARRLQQREGDLGIVVVDYLQLMSSRSRAENRQVEVAEMSRSLKLIARDLKCPVVALSQLSRQSEQNKRKPMMSDLRESGAIEQDADIVMFLHRPGDTQTEADFVDAGKVEVIVAKHRNGPTDTIELAWLKNYARFDNIREFDEPRPGYLND